MQVEWRFKYENILYDQCAFLRPLIIPVTWANVTPDTGRLFDSRLSGIGCAGASLRHGGQALLLNCENDSHGRYRLRNPFNKLHFFFRRPIADSSQFSPRVSFTSSVSSISKRDNIHIS